MKSQVKSRNGIAFSIWLLAIISGIAIALLMLSSLDNALGITSKKESANQNQEIIADDPPVLIAFKELLGPDFQPAMPLQAAAGCNMIAPVLSGTTDTMQLAMYPTGMGGKAFIMLKECSGSKAEATSVETTIGKISWTSYSAGDAIISVPTTDASPAVEENLVKVLGSQGCLDMFPTIQDATRNPIADDYTQWAPIEIITTKLPETTTDPGPESAVPSLEELTGPLTPPEGIQGPPLPVAPTQPTALEWPGPRPTSLEIGVPAPDFNGPGCGWNFNKTTAPTINETAIAEAAKEARKNGEQELIAIAAAWETEVSDYKTQLPTYQKQVATWNEYLVSATEIQAQWQNQVELLAQWEKDNENQLEALEEYNKLKAVYDAAQTRWNALVTDCEISAQNANRDPQYCQNLPKPEELANPLPEPPPATPPPTLWQPGN